MFYDRDRVFGSLKSGFENRRILVVGDLMLDQYIWGEVTRISPEAPVPVVKRRKQTETLGGAGNVALNLARLKLQVMVAGCVGVDHAGDTVANLLKQAGIDIRAVHRLASRPTTVKTRILSGHNQILRLDIEDATPVADLLQPDRIDAFLPAFEDVSAIVLSDYNKGMLTEPLCQAVITAARRFGIPVLVDPKGHNYHKYAGATALSPNRVELAEATGLPVSDLDALLAGGARLREELGLDFLAVTLSEQGSALIEPAQIRRFPAVAREVFDVCGAGDTVIATLAACLAANLDWADSMRLANLAAGIVVGKAGTVPVDAEELLDVLVEEEPAKLCSLEVLQRRVDSWRARGERVVFTNGCFDLLHAGHVICLEQARRRGDRLVVGLNSDRSVQTLKGPTRPFIPEKDRARLLAALACVDAVVLFEERTPLHVIQAIRPDVLVKGGDYAEETIVGAREVRSWGGEVLCVPLVEGRSTTNLARKLHCATSAEKWGG